MKALEHLRTINHHKFLVGCKYFQGDRSPNNAEREATGVSTAWLHHKGRNKHHYEYWIDYTTEKEHLLTGTKMPTRYVIEMFMDRVAASKTYQKEHYKDCHPLEYYEHGAAKLGNMVHKDTAALLHHLLKMLAEQGEERTFSYIRTIVLKAKGRRRPVRRPSMKRMPRRRQICPNRD